MRVPIYRPEITVYERDRDGLWQSSRGTMTNTLFYAMGDEDTVTDVGFRKVVKLGSEPAFVVIAPQGSEMITRGQATFLRSPEGKVYDGINTLILAKRRDSGFDLARQDRPAPSPVAIAPLPIPIRPRGPARKHSMF